MLHQVASTHIPTHYTRIHYIDRRTLDRAHADIVRPMDRGTLSLYVTYTQSQWLALLFRAVHYTSLVRCVPGSVSLSSYNAADVILYQRFFENLRGCISLNLLSMQIYRPPALIKPDRGIWSYHSGPTVVGLIHGCPYSELQRA